jgi:pyruvate kinase
MPGSTDLMKVETVPEVLGRGTGVLDFVVSGRVRRLDFPPTVAAEEVAPDDILVVAKSDRTLVPMVRRAAGLITEQGGPSCHARLLAQELGIPAIVGVENATETLTEGMEIIMNTGRGLIYAGRRAGFLND